MIDDGFGSGEVPDDSPWRPDADVRFDHPPIRSFATPSVDAPDADRPRVGSAPASASADEPPSTLGGAPTRPLALGAVMALTLVLVGVFVVVTVQGTNGALGGDIGEAAPSAGDGPAEVSATAMVDVGGDVTLDGGDVALLAAPECSEQRLPAAVDPLWNTELADARQIVSPVTVGTDSVVAVVGFDDGSASGFGSVAVVGLNLDDGLERWRAPLEPTTGRHEIIGVVDRAVIVRSAAGPDMTYRRLFAFDEGSGELLWDRGFRGDWSAAVNATTGLVYVGVRRPGASANEESEVEVIHPRSGDRVHVAGGAFVGFGPDGRLVTRLGDKVLATAVETRDLLGVVDPDDSPFAVVGSQVVVADDEVSGLRVFSGDGRPRQFPLLGSPGVEAPGYVVALAPLGESSVLVHGDGYVYGAQIGDDTVELRWRVRGVVLESAPTDRGRSMLVATDGGAQQRVIDSSTGRTIVDLELRPGTFTTLTLAANGVAVQDYVDGELVRVALGLDGRELWSLPGSGAFAVGSGVIIDVDDSDAVRVVALGEPVSPEGAPIGCDSVVAEVISR